MGVFYYYYYYYYLVLFVKKPQVKENPVERAERAPQAPSRSNVSRQVDVIDLDGGPLAGDKDDDEDNNDDEDLMQLDSDLHVLPPNQFAEQKKIFKKNPWFFRLFFFFFFLQKCTACDRTRRRAQS